MKCVYLTLFFLLPISVVYSQLIKVIDIQTRLALPYATIKFNNDKTGLVGDEHGIIQLNVVTTAMQQSQSNDSLFISYIGYQEVKLPLATLLNKRVSDTITISMNLFREELPPVIFTPPSPDSLLLYAFLNTINKAENTRTWQNTNSRKWLMQDSASVSHPIYLTEEEGERFSNKITLSLLTGSRREHAWISTRHIRTLGSMPNRSPFYMLESDFWLNYDMHFYMPLSPQLFDKKMEKVYNEHGEATKVKIQLTPLKYGRLSLIRIADNKISTQYYTLFNTVRTFYIDLSDTTISELHVVDANQYKVKGKELTLQQTGMSVHYQFSRYSEQKLYLSYASIVHMWRDEKANITYNAFQQIWLQTPENADNNSITEIAARTKRPVSSTTFKRDGKTYLFSLNQSEKAILNDAQFWKGKKMPDYLLASTWYRLFAADPNYVLFVN